MSNEIYLLLVKRNEDKIVHSMENTQMVNAYDPVTWYYITGKIRRKIDSFARWRTATVTASRWS